MAGIIIDLDKFGEQIKAYNKASKSVDGVDFNIGAESIKLKSIERYYECFVEMNNVLYEYSQLSEASKVAIENVITIWQGKDESIALKMSEM